MVGDTSYKAAAAFLSRELGWPYTIANVEYLVENGRLRHHTLSAPHLTDPGEDVIPLASLFAYVQEAREAMAHAATPDFVPTAWQKDRLAIYEGKPEYARALQAARELATALMASHLVDEVET